MLGAPRKMVMSEEDRRRTAYHEAGHAIVGMLTPGADPVRKVSIIPRGRALGVTFSSPDNDRVSYDREALDAQIDVLLGGRVAEEVVFESITTGAESDIEQVTDHRPGDGRPLGHVGARSASSPRCPPTTATRSRSPASEATRRVVDDEVSRIVDARPRPRRARCSRSTAASWTRWPTRCSRTRRSTRTTPTRRRA